MKLKYFKIFLFFLCISCGYTNKEISQIVKEWQNKEIIFHILPQVEESWKEYKMAD